MAGPAQLPGQHDRERHLVHLQAAEHRLAVQPGVLREGAVGPLLHRPQVIERPVGGGGVTGGQQGGRDLVQVA
jgi:hypothetical protein